MNSYQVKEAIYQAAQYAMNGNANDMEAEVLQNIVGMIHTLIMDDRLGELALVMCVSFPAYYDFKIPVDLYPPIHLN